MELYKQILPVVTEKKDRENILKKLSKNYRAIFESSKDIFSKTGITSLGALNSSGDLYFDGKNLFYVSIPDGKNYIEAGILSKENTANDSFEDFKSTILSVIMKGRSIDSEHWKNYNYINERFNLIREGALGAQVSEEDRATVNALSNQTKRLVLKELSKKENCFIDSLTSVSDKNNLFDTIESLSSLKLINRDYFVYCRQSGTQISKVTNLDYIQEASARGLKCPHCGKTFLEERIEQGLSLTQFGEKFTKPNLWLAIHVILQLEQINIDTKNILIREENNYKNLDIFVNHYGKLVYISIKEDDLVAHDTYMFKMRASIYKANASVLICGKPLKHNDKSYLTSDPESNIEVIEYGPSLKNKLQMVFDEQKINHISKTLKGFDLLSKFQIDKIVAEHLFLEQKNKLESAIGRQDYASPENSETPPMTNIAGSLSVSESKMLEEDSELLIEEMINAPRFTHYEEESFIEPETVQEEMVKEPIEPFEAQEEAQEELQEDAEENAVEDFYEEIVEESSDEPMMIEENINMEFSGIKDSSSIPELSYEDKLADEKYSEFKLGFKDLADGIGLAGHWQELEELFNTLSENSSCLISSKNGMPITERRMENYKTDILSAYSAALLSEVTTIPLFQNKVTSIFIDYPEYNSYIDVTKDYVTICNNSKDPSKNEMFTDSGNLEFRASMLNNIFKELKEIDGVSGCVLLDNNMDISEENLDNTGHTEIIQGFCNEFIQNENSVLNKFIQIKQYRQICIISEDYIYSFIPLGDGAIFASISDSSAPREIWNLKMADSAKILA